MNDLVVQDSAPWGRLIERAVSDPDFPLANIQELYRMKREFDADQSRRAFNRAMADAQQEMQPVLRDATNTHTNSKYARIETIDRDLRPIYTRHGFSVRYGSEPSPRDDWMRITCTIAHADGYSETNHLDSPLDAFGTGGRSNKTGVQATGSTVTYLRRYLLCMCFNVMVTDLEDDDGEAQRVEGRDRQSERAYAPQRAQAPRAQAPQAPAGVERLAHEPNATHWLKILDELTHQATTLGALHEIATAPSVLDALLKAPSLIKDRINEALRVAYDRLAPPPVGEGREPYPEPVVEAMLAEVDGMDAITLAGLAADGPWQQRLRDLEFPPDADAVRDHIETRITELRKGGTNP